jgi:hypothetical protein
MTSNGSTIFKNRTFDTVVIGLIVAVASVIGPKYLLRLESADVIEARVVAAENDRINLRNEIKEARKDALEATRALTTTVTNLNNSVIRLETQLQYIAPPARPNVQREQQNAEDPWSG